MNKHEQNKLYDITIIGLGAAGSHLLLAMMDDPFFDSKRILILEKEPKEKHDRTWSFWEKNDGRFDHICENIWSQGDYFSRDKRYPLELKEYRYKTLHSNHFYTLVREKLESKANVFLLEQTVHNVADIGEKLRIDTEQTSIDSYLVFDSRIPEDFENQADFHVNILQHFKGWLINSKKPVFNSDSFTIMDYRVNYKDQTCFTYVLPYDAHRAVIETTFFTEFSVEDAVYDDLLNKYISEILNIDDFVVEHEEFGVIPMSTFPFQHYNTDKHIRIGTAGGWVKASSGYMFRMAQDKAAQMLANYKQSLPINQSLFKAKYRFYDRLLLDVLKEENKLGPAIFTASYGANPLARLFRFLDEKSSLLDDIRFILSMPKAPFLRALWRQRLNIFK